eukprot:GEMP01030998.1.p1 GENE.GEMP01030998.1~~GEMP01030998.1.p1  ORF type:complete len:476 (+),score=100.85 GEMP01030998.1:144-1571(+)
MTAVMMMVTMTVVVFKSFLVCYSGVKPLPLEGMTKAVACGYISLGGDRDRRMKVPAADIPSTSRQFKLDVPPLPSHAASGSRLSGSGISLSPEKVHQRQGRQDAFARHVLTLDALPRARVVEGNPNVVISSSALGFFPETGGTSMYIRKNAQLQNTTIHVDVDNVRYHVQQFLAKDKTGFAFRAVAVDGNASAAAPGREYAIRFSKLPEKGPRDQLNKEMLRDFNTMQMLKLQGCKNVPEAIAMGRITNEGNQWSTVMVSEYIGHDMYYERNQLNHQRYTFSEEDTLWYAIKLVDALRELHDTHHMVHRDIKLANILVKKSPHSERAEDHELFLIDFGTAMRYVTDAGMHVPATYQRNRQGSQQYVSVRVINHKLGGRQDDMHAALLAVLEMKQYLTPREAVERGENIANFDRAWARKMAEPRRKVPQALRDLWDVTYNPSLKDTPKWQERPDYDLWDRKLRGALAELDSVSSTG